MINGMGMGFEVPVAMSMLLAQDPLAMDRYSAMDDDEKGQVLQYVRGGVDGDDAEHRITHTVNSLHDGVPGFYRQ